jgi:glutathione S-transferase
MMTNLILHHYPQSPVTEKVRVVLGMKSLSWNSVEIPRIPPKPDLMPLTGGYRRTPVMQIGANIYCDSLCIIRELERRFPQQGVFSDGHQRLARGLDWGLSKWTDGPMFSNAITVVLGSAKELPEDFAADRIRLYFGPDFNLGDLQQKVQESIVQLSTQFGWVETQLRNADKFLSGGRPGLADALVYHLVWFVRGRWEFGPEFLCGFPELEKWEQAIRDIGHGTPLEMDSKQALNIARENEPVTGKAINQYLKWNGLELGSRVHVTPEGNGGDPIVSGELHSISEDTVCVLRNDSMVGNLAVHFPVSGYRIYGQ